MSVNAINTRSVKEVLRKLEVRCAAQRDAELGAQPKRSHGAVLLVQVQQILV